MKSSIRVINSTKKYFISNKIKQDIMRTNKTLNNFKYNTPLQKKIIHNKYKFLNLDRTRQMNMFLKNNKFLNNELFNDIMNVLIRVIFIFSYSFMFGFVLAKMRH